MKPLEVASLEDSRPKRVLGFDLENRPLAYWYDGQATSEITAFSWKWTDEDDVHFMLLRPDGYFECDDGSRVPDGMAYATFSGFLGSADLVFGHNIRRHDLPMFNAGLLRRGLDTCPAVLTQDTLRDYPKRGGMSASLENLASMYGLEGEKFIMSQPMWEDANRLTESGMELARKRVVADVLLQERLRERVLPLLKAPRMWNP